MSRSGPSPEPEIQIGDATMFDHDSRYYDIPDAVHVGPDGQEMVYKRRRFLPRGEDLPLLREVTVQTTDRPDLVAARTLGQPELFWRIADANDAMDPQALTREPGRTLRVAGPETSRRMPLRED